MKDDVDVSIIGAGLSGLSAALELHLKGKTVRIYESNPYVGGRVATDDFQWYKLDRGFQVLLTAYPECKRVLNYQLLDLKPFDSGVTSRFNGTFSTLYNPIKHPIKLIKSLFKGVVAPSDFYKLIKLGLNLSRADAQKLIQDSSGSALSVIKKYELSPALTDQFLKPFLRGILLDYSLTCPGKLVDFTMKMLIDGQAALPVRGMRSIPRQLASRLPSDTVQLNTLVQSIQQNKIVLHNGTIIDAKKILVACDPWSTARILGLQQPPSGREIANLYFSTKKPPFKEPILVVNGEPNGIINNLAILSNVASRYVEDRSSLVSVTVLEEGIKNSRDNLDKGVREELRDWYGPEVDEWRHLHTYRIRNAHPQSYPLKLWSSGNFKVKEGIYACGDYLETPSINSAMLMGFKAAEQILQDK